MLFVIELINFLKYDLFNEFLLLLEGELIELIKFFLMVIVYYYDLVELFFLIEIFLFIDVKIVILY